MLRVFFTQTDLLGHPDHWHRQALHDLMQAEGFRPKQPQLVGCDPLADTSYFGRSETTEGALKSSLRNRIAEAVWGHALVRVSALA